MVYRNRQKGFINGVAAGISEAYGIHVAIVRLLFAISSLAFGFGIFAYFLLSAMLPDRSGQTHLNFQ